MRFNFAEAIIETSIESSIEIYCKIFLGIEIDDLAYCMSGKLEYTESTDLEPEMYSQFLEKMKRIEEYGRKLNEELKSSGKIIELGDKNKNFD